MSDREGERERERGGGGRQINVPMDVKLKTQFPNCPETCLWVED